MRHDQIRPLRLCRRGDCECAAVRAADAGHRGRPSAGAGYRTAARSRKLSWALPRPSPGSETRLAPALRSRLAAGSFPDYELDSTAACLAVVCDGVAVTVVPRSLALEACRDGTLAALALPPARPDE
ncbi:MAG: hypothetical protein WDN69_19520 [Aliidongia sp.]